jgi:hypothetical protein
VVFVQGNAGGVRHAVHRPENKRNRTGGRDVNMRFGRCGLGAGIGMQRGVEVLDYLRNGVS